MSITENVRNITSIAELGYSSKKNETRNLKPFFYLTKKGYKDLFDESEEKPIIVGDVYIHQKCYKDIESSANPKKTEAEKEKKDIIGIATVPYSRKYLQKHPDGEEFRKYDLYKYSNYLRRVIGYAEVGENQYVRLVMTNPLLWLILLLLLLLLPCFLKSCPKIDPIPINAGQSISQKENRTKDAPICYYAPFEEKTILTKDNPCITLTNVNTNENEYYISFSIYINGTAMKDEKGEIFTTGAIPPNRQVNINLWNELDEGVYKLEAIATDYNYEILNELTQHREKYSDKDYAELLNEATMPVSHTLSTILIVEK